MNNQSNEPKNKKNRKMNSKRIVALIGIILLLSLYVVTLLVAIFDRSESGKWFMTCLVASVFLPLLIWVYIWLYGVITNRHTIASFDLDNPKEEDN